MSPTSEQLPQNGWARPYPTGSNETFPGPAWAVALYIWGAVQLMILISKFKVHVDSDLYSVLSFSFCIPLFFSLLTQFFLLFSWSSIFVMEQMLPIMCLAAVTQPSSLFLDTDRVVSERVSESVWENWDWGLVCLVDCSCWYSTCNWNWPGLIYWSRALLESVVFIRYTRENFLPSFLLVFFFLMLCLAVNIIKGFSHLWTIYSLSKIIRTWFFFLASSWNFKFLNIKIIVNLHFLQS